MSTSALFPILNRRVINRSIALLSPKTQYTRINCSHRYLYIPTSSLANFTTSPRFNMREAIVAKGPKVTIHDVPVPKPGTSQILIKVVYSGSNPKDWKRPDYGEPHNSGDDIAGFVEAVGEGVYEFKKGDRVAAFHEMMSPHGRYVANSVVTCLADRLSFAEYAISWDYTTFHLPEKTSFEEVSLISMRELDFI